ncbi:MAG: cellulose biosynthesis cyclic di-GMP-binding regulatory protein BcsB [Deltaproteobacteria bacterium]|nr:cellulose biosynthesis cyclic di-GMP-binding regulatory protein BcsB [Deltaproteobacteria bacterium]
MIVEAFKMDNIALYGGLLMLKADKVYRFKTLGFNTHSFEGFQPSSREITFRLPADFLIKENQQAELKINFSYGAGMRADSALNILLNDTRVRVINLSKQEGDTIEGYKIAIPTFLFKPGTNTIKFTPVLTPLTRECELIQPESLFLTVFENSTFYIPPMPHYVEMPQIGLFMMNGFPFTSWPDGYESSIYLTSADSNTINAALNMVGLITQRNSYPFFGVDIHVGKDSIVYGDRRDIIVIGDLDSIPEDLRMSAPIKMLKSSDVKYPVVNTLGESPTFVSSRQISGLGHGAGAIMEFQSPYKAGRTVLLLTATTTADLLTLSNAMLEPNIQGQSKGDVVVVEYTNPEFKVSTLDVGTKYFTGKSGRFSRIGYYLYSRPYLYFGLIFILILFISGSVFYGLRKYRRKDVVNSEDSWIGKQEGLLNRLKALLIKIFIKK